MPQFRYRAATQTGALARQAARCYEHRLGMGLDQLTGAIESAAIIVVSLVMGSLILSIMSALFSITELAT
jgi:general secretion pathway protein F